jgi:flagellar protein FlaG
MAMRVISKGSEVDIELIRQVSRQALHTKNVILEGVLKSSVEDQNSHAEDVKLSSEELQRIIQEIKRKLDYLNRYLKIDIDQDLEIPVVKIFEKDTNRLIRQIPPDHLLQIMKRIDQMLGVFLNERV